MKEYFDKLYIGSNQEFFQRAGKALEREEKMFVVTANPETLMMAEQTPEFGDVLRSPEAIIVPDGIGVLKAAAYLGMDTNGRVTGCDLAAYLIKEAGNLHKSIYLYGAKEEVVAALVTKIKAEQPGAVIAGYRNGYGQDDNEVFDEIALLQPDIVFVALGIPRQELIIHRNLSRFQKGIFVGVGGSFDVLSGMKKRAPLLFQKLNLEWLYRIASEPKRFSRFYKSNVKFLGAIKKLKKESRE